MAAQNVRDERIAVHGGSERLADGGILERDAPALVPEDGVVARRAPCEEVVGPLDPREVARGDAAHAVHRARIKCLYEIGGVRVEREIEIADERFRAEVIAPCLQAVIRDRAVGLLVIGNEFVGAAADRLQIIIGEPPVAGRRVREEMLRQDVQILQIVAEESVGIDQAEREFQLAYAAHGDALPAVVKRRAGIGVLDGLHGEDHVVGGELRAVLPMEAAFQPHVPRPAVGRRRDGIRDVVDIAVDHLHEREVGFGGCRHWVHVLRLADHAFGVGAARRGNEARRLRDVQARDDDEARGRDGRCGQKNDPFLFRESKEEFFEPLHVKKGVGCGRGGTQSRIPRGRAQPDAGCAPRYTCAASR